MFLLGTIAPLPKRMEWASEEVEATIAGAQELLLPPTVSMRAEGAAFGGIFLIPSLLKARNNPQKESLADVLPAQDYARWSGLKRKYLGRDRGIEKRRAGEEPPAGAEPVVSLLEWLRSPPDELRERYDRLYFPRNDSRYLIRNALVAAGNSADKGLVDAVRPHAEGDDRLLREHAEWALDRLGDGA